VPLAISNTDKIFKTVCHMCNRPCGMNAYVKGNRVVKVVGMPEHHISQGRLCPKGLAAGQYENDPNRLKHPLMRVGNRGEGRWKQVSWDEAIDISANNLLQTKEKHGAKSISFYKGQGGGWDPILGYVKRFMSVLGSPNFITHSHLCHVPIMMGHSYTMGSMPVSDIEHSKCIILWGFNPFTSSITNVGRRIMNAKESGTTLVAIDPRLTAAGAKSNISVQPRPGTDGALALGMLNVIIEEELYDKEFVSNWTYGFDKLEEFIKQYTPEKVESITWVPAITIRQVARLYASTKPASIIVGNGVDQHTNTVQTVRTIAILMALSGNLDQPGGNVFLPPEGLANVTLADKFQTEAESIDKHPLFYRMWSVPGSDMVDTLISGKPYPLKAMIVMAGDPARSLSNTKRVTEALKNLDFLIVHDIFMTAAAELADIVLPSTTWLESTQLLFYPRNASAEVDNQLIVFRNKVVDPPGECHSDLEFIFELARKLGYADYFPWGTIEQAFEEQLKPVRITINELKSHPEGMLRVRSPKDLYRKYEKQGFATPTKKVELYSTIFEKYGYDPLPTFEEPGESPFSQPNLAKEYPFICSDAIKPILYTHNQFRTVPWLREIMPDPWVEIHPQDAKELNIVDGEHVIVETPRGQIEVKTKLSNDIHPNTVFLPHGWGEPYAHGSADNEITPDSIRCPISGATGNRSFLCKIVKLKNGKAVTRKQYAILANLDRCVGCFACQVACKQENNSVSGSPWIRVNQVGPELVNGRLKMEYIPIIQSGCIFQSCMKRNEQPSCVFHCPTRTLEVCSSESILDKLESGNRCQVCVIREI